MKRLATLFVFSMISFTCAISLAETPIITSIGPTEIMPMEANGNFTNTSIVIKGENLGLASKARIKKAGETQWRPVQTTAKTDDNDIVIALVATINKQELAGAPAKFDLRVVNAGGEESNLVGFSTADGECREPLVSTVEPQIVSIDNRPDEFKVTGGIFSFKATAKLVGDDGNVYAQSDGALRSNFELVLKTREVEYPATTRLKLVIVQPFCAAPFEFPNVVTVNNEATFGESKIASVSPSSMLPKESIKVVATITNPESFDFNNFTAESADPCLIVSGAQISGPDSISMQIESRSSCSEGEKAFKIITGGLELLGKITILPKK